MLRNSASSGDSLMSDFVVHKGRRATGMFARHYGADVANVHYEHEEPTTVMLTDERAGAGTCLGCGSAPCMEKDDTELTLFGTLDVFPGDPSRDVCPTRAIRWDGESSTAFVAADDCIGCGLCVSRCPYGAISLGDGLTARVEATDPDGLVVAGPTQGEHPQVKRSGQIGTLDAPAASNLPTTIAALDDGRTTLLVRNLLNEVGLNARTRRRGDTNMRIDAVGFSRSQRPFVAEIETGADVLDSPRALLEDVAVRHSRYGYAVDGIDPVSVILTFPNVRSEYYQVIRDIERVLGLRCRTITVGALVTLLWNCAKLDGFDGDAFTIGEKTINLADCLGVDASELVEPYPGAFTPAK
jgi:Fe-S-cluster-containing hydrogenase component 2